jgi:hypothetical protein
LADWDHEPNQITIRKITGDDGTTKIQMRLDLGVLQMEVTGRPDGRRPFGCESLLCNHQQRLKEHSDKNGTELGFELTPDECSALRDEALQYYHRYLAEFVLEDFAGVERDTTRNLQVLDLCRDNAREEADRLVLEQHRPYLVMMNIRAKAHLALRRGAFKTALARVNAGLNMIREIMVETDQEEVFEELTEVGILQSLAREIAARLPEDPLAKLETQLQLAIEEERYEDAAVLHDRLTGMRTPDRAAPVRKRRG